MKQVKSLTEIKQEYSGVSKLFVSERSNDVYVSSIIVNKDMRNQGIGTKIMKDIIEYANSINKPVTLTPSKDLGGKITKLREFYKDLGFNENKGSKRNLQVNAAMIRNPNMIESFIESLRTESNTYMIDTILSGCSLVD